MRRSLMKILFMVGEERLASEGRRDGTKVAGAFAALLQSTAPDCHAL
jgi:hypothetical protein